MMLWQQLRMEPGITCLTGGGGKTSLAHALAEQLPGRVIFCTTTKIYPSEKMPVLCGEEEGRIAEVLSREKAVCIGTPVAAGKLAAPGTSMAALRALADYVLVEADGSKGLPIKAHAAYEPVILPTCDRHIMLVGASGFGKKISLCVHRPELFMQQTGAGAEDLVTPELLAALLRRELQPDALVVNQVTTPRRMALAQQLAHLLELPVFAGEVRHGVLKRLN